MNANLLSDPEYAVSGDIAWADRPEMLGAGSALSARMLLLVEGEAWGGDED